MVSSTPYTPLRLSYSTLALVHGCARKYQLLKLSELPAEFDDIEIESNKNRDALDFGYAYGVGAQHYFATGNKDEALMWALKVYNFVETPVKNLASLVLAIDSLYIPNGWEVLSLTNQRGETKQANEISFKIILDKESGDYYCGYIDLIMQHGETIFPLDFKTTGINRSDLDPLYYNSSQVNGYACVLDVLFPSLTSYDVVYDVAQFKNNIVPTRHIKPYSKTPHDKLEWLIALQIDYRAVKQYHELQFFPKKGNHCMAFNRVCSFFKLCDMQSLQDQLYPKAPKKEEDWDFVLDLEELIEYATRQVKDYVPKSDNFIRIETGAAMEEIVL